ncbi:hypothetical protein [Pisciglobus halotolerans]|uniref:Uncharacterized protein n=1 Tax=Pisciglobus halotolerans TaxID=745365 RepID=A0A1I3C1Y9_9LACT|nr:hypothetical protein [Pisciglobus halotolerans]SFH68470.1 hypothetical protein SAMN04489868_11222 [Pisciglobus halotolerans]
MSKGMSEPLKSAQKRYESENRERRNYLKQRTSARSFIRNKAEKEDLEELREMINEREKMLEEYEALKNFVEDDLSEKELGSNLTGFDISAILKGKTVSCYTKDFAKTIVEIKLASENDDEKNNNVIDSYIVDSVGKEMQVSYLKAKK